ncbi:SDR family NAD(P)-dependent oxidoreductase [Rhodococcus opacus]|uniref:SDR family NAD(P)-dependent oxidoreductase n=1 Tax=Rhodococcus opacus TaxID=37919 RepID=UPI0009B64930|nr:SDR family oxidoreductase [Rhodococcus opacus PD630]
MDRAARGQLTPGPTDTARKSHGRETAEKVVAETGVKAVAFVCDTSDPGRVSSVAEDVRSDLGPVEVFVNNAGIVGADDLMETPLDN